MVKSLAHVMTMIVLIIIIVDILRIESVCILKK